MRSMVERTESPLARWRRRRGRIVALALTAVLAVLAAPLRTALRVGCDLCPPDCPMHERHLAAGPHADGRTTTLHCHNAGHAPLAAGPENRQRLTRPPCANHTAIVSLELGPMLPPRALPLRSEARRALAPPPPGLADGRGADPPDTPPPLARA